jgi:hypothetical protein
VDLISRLGLHPHLIHEMSGLRWGVVLSTRLEV